MNLVVAILGPTASGKSSFVLEWAEKVGGEIVLLDSTMVYRGFNLGSNKPSPSEQKIVPHHLIDILDPLEPFSAFHFVERANQVLVDIHQRNKLPIIVGGTYFYLKALQIGMFPLTPIPNEVIEELENRYLDGDTIHSQKMHETLLEKDPESAKTIHPNDKYRLLRALAILETQSTLPSQLKAQIVFKEQKERIWLKYAMLISRHDLHQNISSRTDKMIKCGIIDETKNLLEKYPTARALNSIGYLECKKFLSNQLTEKALRNEIIQKTQSYAKRQMVWLKSDPEIRYIDSRDEKRVCLEISNLKHVLGAA